MGETKRGRYQKRSQYCSELTSRKDPNFLAAYIGRLNAYYYQQLFNFCDFFCLAFSIKTLVIIFQNIIHLCLTKIKLLSNKNAPTIT